MQLRFALAFIALPWLAQPAHAEWRSVGNADAVREERNGIVAVVGERAVRISALAPDLVRVTCSRPAAAVPAKSQILAKAEWPPVAVEMGSDAGLRTIRTAEIEVRVQLSPLRIAFYDRSGRLISKDDDSLGMASNGDRVRCWKSMPPDEHYFGLGEKIGPLDKRGRAHVMWNTDFYAYDIRLGENIYINIPFFVALREGRAYGLLFHNTYRSSFDLGAESPEYYSFGAENGDLDYYFFYGPDPKKVLSRYTELTGRTPLPPRWALGYQQTRYGYDSEKYVRFIADNFRQRRIPCDGIVVDIDYMNGYRTFTWDKSRFPDPRRMIADLREQGIRTILYQDPGVKVDPGYGVYQEGTAGGYFLKKPDGTPFVGRVWPGDSVFPDFTSERVRQWWGGLHKTFLDEGVAGFENDMNEPAVFNFPGHTMPNDVVAEDGSLARNHNLYGLLMTRAAYEARLKLQPDRRPFQTTRSTFAGGQRYSAVFTGDNTSTWTGLGMSFQVLLTMGLSGFPHAGSEIGGFGLKPSPELYARWIEAGVFYPYCRTSTAEQTPNQEPWSFGNQVEEISRRAIELRYRLLPYLYNAFRETSETGVPVMRALVLEFPDDPEALAQDYEFLFGPDLLVAPVYKDDEREWPVYLPRGAWYDFWTDRRYQGPGRFVVPAPLERIPIFVRAGAIIPTQQVVQYTDQAPIDPLTLDIYPDRDSRRSYYEDDGITFEYRRGASMTQEFRAAWAGGRIEINISARNGAYNPPARSLVLRIHGVRNPPARVQVNGAASSGWSFAETESIVSIKVPDRGLALRAEVFE
jgi:alpha-glucosidase